ncbi:rhodanese-like domain-containing protein [Enterococcus rivorum]|uniref:Sulfurtransferase n=1 Tax=Enterococcus rivorum TaxID=762845 RepID=A0A1E5KTQ0_9ENTE|nr:rhodanese-like domain-containing protein [Enterococcus rivorum]MBP2097911.1 rhodanese-related sulfurtransferase [Enterococcus rivorum]OEH81236.1 sulfurtransferase [Enterococcus rivorum]
MHQSITMQDFESLCQEDFINVIDIRNTESYLEGHLPQSISLPATVLPNNLNRLDKSKVYYIISYSGRRSKTIAGFMSANGFKAIHVIGGMKQLQQKLSA